MDMYFTFDKATRTLSSNRKAYAGQVFDSNSTRLYFTLLDEGEDWDFTKEDFVPNIVFDVLDDRGFPFVYGLNSSPVFNGISFEVPYDITSRARSARVNFQLWFVSAKYQDTFDGTPNGMLRTEYLLSATAGIAIKPSCVKPPSCGCADAPYSPATSPGLIGPIEFYRENALLMPIEVTQELNGAGLNMSVHTLSGRVQTAYLPVATITEDGKIKVENLPTGNQADQIPKLISTVNTGQALVYGQVDSVLGTVKGFMGADVAQSLEYVAYRDEGNAGIKRHLIILKDINGTALSTIDLPIENLVDSVEYDPVTKKILFHFDDPDRDFAIPVNDLVDVYEPVEGELYVSPGTGGASGESTVYTIGLAPAFKEKLNANISRLDGRIDLHLDDVENPHNVTKAQVGLGNADNTSDLKKPVSEAQRAAIDEVQRSSDQVQANLDTAIAENLSAHDAIGARITEVSDRLTALDDRESKVTQDTNLALAARYDKSETDKLLATKLPNYAAGDHINFYDGKINADLSDRYTKSEADDLLATKMDTLLPGDHINFYGGKINVDTTGIEVKADAELSQVSERPIQNQAVTKALAKKNPTLVAGEKIRIVTNSDGSQTISATQPTIEVDTEINALSVNPVQNKVIKRALDGKANIGEGVSVWKGQTSDGVNYLYQSGDVVVYDWNLYVSKVDNNDHHPTDEDCWNVVRSGAVSKEIGLTAATYIGVFGNETDTEYTIEHKLGSRNLVFSFMRADGSYSFVTSAVVSAPTLNTIRVKLTSPPGVNAIAVNIIKAKTYREGAATEYPLVVNVNEAAARWTCDNDTNLPLYVKAYDENGNDLMGDIVQSSLSGFDPVTVSFTEAHSGKMVVASTDESHVYLQQDLAGTPVTLVENEGNDRYLVQCFKDGEGQSRLDIIQYNGKITVSATDVSHWTGYVALYKASAVKAFTASDLKEETATDGSKVYTLTYQHNKNRMVCAQIYAGEAGLALADIHCPTDNSVKIYLNSKISGELLIL